MARRWPACCLPRCTRPGATRDLDSYFDLTAGVLQSLRRPRARHERDARRRIRTSACTPVPSCDRASSCEADSGHGRAGSGRSGQDEREPSLDDLAFVQFTSGATSEPKGVALTHRNLCENVNAINGPHGLATTDADSAVSWLPLHHDMGLVGMALGPLYASRPAVFLPTHAFVRRPAEWLRAISRHRATVSFAPNFAYDLCVRRVKDVDLDGVDLSCWRVAGCGAEPIHAPTLAAFADRFAPLAFARRAFCPGTASPNTSWPRRSRRAAGRSAPTARWSAAACRCPAIVCGLSTTTAPICPSARSVRSCSPGRRSCRATYETRRADARSRCRDGWLRTGDLGYLADGELYVCGRVKDLIIANGRKIHPQDLEWGVDELSGIRRGRTVAFGTSDDDGRDRLVMIVEPTGTVDAEQLAAGVRRRIADLYGLFVDDVVVAPGGTVGADVERKSAARADEGAIRARRDRRTARRIRSRRKPPVAPCFAPSPRRPPRSGSTRRGSFSSSLPPSTEVVVVGATRGAADDFVRASPAAPARRSG